MKGFEEWSKCRYLCRQVPHFSLCCGPRRMRSQSSPGHIYMRPARANSGAYLRSDLFSQSRLDKQRAVSTVVQATSLLTNRCAPLAVKLSCQGGNGIGRFVVTFCAKQSIRRMLLRLVKSKFKILCTYVRAASFVCARAQNITHEICESWHKPPT